MFRCALIIIVGIVSVSTGFNLDDTHINVGSVLFHPSDLERRYWSNSDLALLQARKEFQNLLPSPSVIDPSTNYVDQLISYIQNAYKSIHDESPSPEVDSILTTALSDAVGGYFQLWVLPITKFAYYGGSVSYYRAIKLFKLHNEVKRFLDSDGDGWQRPDEGILNTLAVRVPKSHKPYIRSMDNPCQYLSYFEKLDAGYTIPMPNIDWETKTISVPLKNMSLVSMYSPKVDQILIKYYGIAKSCLKDGFPDAGLIYDDKVRTKSVNASAEYEERFQRWLADGVVSHLTDEYLYTPLGSVLSLIDSMSLGCFVQPTTLCSEPECCQVNCFCLSKTCWFVIFIVFVEVVWCISALYHMSLKKKYDTIKTASNNLFCCCSKPKEDSYCSKNTPTVCYSTIHKEPKRHARNEHNFSYDRRQEGSSLSQTHNENEAKHPMTIFKNHKLINTSIVCVPQSTVATETYTCPNKLLETFHTTHKKSSENKSFLSEVKQTTIANVSRKQLKEYPKGNMEKCMTNNCGSYLSSQRHKARKKPTKQSTESRPEIKSESTSITCLSTESSCGSCLQNTDFSYVYTVSEMAVLRESSKSLCTSTSQTLCASVGVYCCPENTNTVTQASVVCYDKETGMEINKENNKIALRNEIKRKSNSAKEKSKMEYYRLYKRVSSPVHGDRHTKDSYQNPRNKNNFEIVPVNSQHRDKDVPHKNKCSNMFELKIDRADTEIFVGISGLTEAPTEKLTRRKPESDSNPTNSPIQIPLQNNVTQSFAKTQYVPPKRVSRLKKPRICVQKSTSPTPVVSPRATSQIPKKSHSPTHTNKTENERLHSPLKVTNQNDENTEAESSKHKIPHTPTRKTELPVSKFRYATPQSPAEFFKQPNTAIQPQTGITYASFVATAPNIEPAANTSTPIATTSSLSPPNHLKSSTTTTHNTDKSSKARRSIPKPTWKPKFTSMKYKSLIPVTHNIAKDDSDIKCKRVTKQISNLNVTM